MIHLLMAFHSSYHFIIVMFILVLVTITTNTSTSTGMANITNYQYF